MNKRFVTKFMMATAAKVTNNEDNDDDSEEEKTNADPTGHAGSMNLIERTLQGIAASSSETGDSGFGRYAKTILLGRSVWASEKLHPYEQTGLHEDTSGADAFPPCKEAEKAAQAASKALDERLMPFMNKTKANTVGSG